MATRKRGAVGLRNSWFAGRFWLYWEPGDLGDLDVL